MKTLSTIKRIIFDFDNTLFDTEALKDIFWHMGSIHGYSFDETQEIYKKARVHGDVITIAIGSFLMALKEHCIRDGKDYNDKKIEHIMTKLTRSQHMLPGAQELLTFCKNKSTELYLLTLGVAAWQEEKVKNSGIDQFFAADHIVYTDDINMGKEKALRELFGDDFKGNDTIFFNDKPDETDNLLQQFPGLFMFVKREVRDGRYTEGDFVTLQKKYPNQLIWSENLSDLLEVLKHSIS